MIYVDSSVLLARILAEDQVPPESLWESICVSSRFAQYEVWTVLHRVPRAESHGALARSLLDRISFLELSPRVLARALDPFPEVVRTLDALHLASAEFLRSQRRAITLATYDARMQSLARKMSLDLEPILEP